jgi:hypothetical protein
MVLEAPECVVKKWRFPVGAGSEVVPPALVTRYLDEWRLWVMGCRSDYVGSASGVPGIADHLLHPRKSAALG